MTILLSQSLFGSSKHLVINKHEFVIVTESYDIYDSKGTFMKFYDANNSKEALFRLTLGDATGNCSERSLEDGSYEVEGDTITLYSLWNRRGKAYLSPYGARIQQFKVLANGKLKAMGGQVYVEESKRNYDKESGMQYLFYAPKNKEEKEELAQYVKDVELKYKATFVFKEEAKTLILKVKEAMNRKLKKTWKRI